MEDELMLVLSRKAGQKIVIGDGITVVVNRISGNRVSVGVEAPPEMHIVRGELQGREGVERPNSPSPVTDFHSAQPPIVESRSVNQPWRS
jgi:carbon storage regulator